MQPLIIESDNIVFFDVDETLVIWNYPKEFENDTVEFNNYGYIEHLVPNQRVIEELKRSKFRGHKVVVWSAGGWEWASEIVRKLGLEQDVDFVMCKPKWIYDDLDPNVWTTRIHLNIKK